MNRLYQKYIKEVRPGMMKSGNYANIMMVPSIEKVTVNVGVGKMEDKIKKRAVEDLARITGQQPAARQAKKSIAGFKIREGSTVGYAVTLRKKKMFDFLDRLISVALPRSRDFKGIDMSAVNRGGLNIGIREQNIFPEVEFESAKDLFGFQVTVTTTARTKEEASELLRLLGFPLKTST